MSPDPTDKVIVEPLTGPVLARAIDRLAVIDPDIQAAVTRIGYPISRLRPKGFATLLRIMVSQQVSTHAAAAIWGRLEAAMDDGATPERFLALDDAALRTVGLSGRKMEYGRGLAQAITGGSLDLEGLGSLSEDDAKALVAGVPRSTSCSRSAAPTAGLPTISPCKSACSA